MNILNKMNGMNNLKVISDVKTASVNIFHESWKKWPTELVQLKLV